jgi:F420-dependent hydroxymycolic acid dehydrogenase
MATTKVRSTRSVSKLPEPFGLGRRTMGYMLPHEQFPAPQLAEFAVAAERAGFDLVAPSDHFQPWQANQAHSGLAWVTMGAIGQITSKVWMGPTVTCPTFRYCPAVVAEAFATLSLFYPSRIFLGIGSGEALNERAAVGSWSPWPERSERLIEATEIIRKLWTGGQIRHKGKYYTVGARLYDRPPRKIPILMAAANGPKAMRRAGQYGDGLVTDPKTWKQHKSEFVRAAKAAGKDPNQMPVLVEQYVVVGSKQDAEAAAKLWRFGPKAFETYFNDPDPHSIQRRSETDISLENVYGERPISTDPEPHLKVVNELFDSGATIVNIHTGQPDQMRVIDFYGKKVLPRLELSRAA